MTHSRPRRPLITLHCGPAPAVEMGAALLVFEGWSGPAAAIDVQTWVPDAEGDRWCRSEWGEVIAPGEPLDHPFAVIRRAGS